MIKIIAIGKIKNKHLKALCDDYAKKINNYHRFEVIEVNDEAIPNKYSDADIEKILDKEAERVLSKLKDEYVILLDIHGQELTSKAFAEKIEKVQTYTSTNITFVIGGSMGVGKELVERSNYRLKLGEMTLLHQMTRLVLLEQIFRAYKILNNEPYNK